MKAILSCCVVLLVVLADIPAQALEPLALYDNFNARHIDPDKWFGGELFGGVSGEASREIQLNRLFMSYRAYGDANSDSGTCATGFGLAFLP